MSTNIHEHRANPGTLSAPLLAVFLACVNGCDVPPDHGLSENDGGAARSAGRASEIDAMELLRSRLGVGANTVPTPDRADDFPGHLMDTRDDQGRLRGLHYFGPSRLRSLAGDPESTVLAFIAENHAAYGLSSKTAWSSSRIDWLRKIEDSAGTTPEGKRYRVLRFDQFHRGHRISDGEITAVFWNDELTSLTGPVVDPTEPLPAVARIRGRDAQEYARARGEMLVGSPLTAQGGTLELNLFQRRLTYRFELGPDAVASDAEPDIDKRLTAEVDAVTGELIRLEDTAGHFGATSASYLVFAPSATGSNPNDVTLTYETANGCLNPAEGNTVYAWQDEAYDRSPLPVYDLSVSWVPGPTVGFFWNNPGNFTFNASPGVPQFRAQHASAWAQYALNTANINFNWWPPNNSSYRYSKVTVLTGCNFFGLASMTGDNGCWGQNLARNSDGAVNQSPRVPCICLSSMPGAVLPNSDAVGLDVIFHEVGHAVDIKYTAGTFRGATVSGTCDIGPEEADSLKEAVAGLYAQMVFQQRWNGRTWSRENGRLDLMTGAGANQPHYNAGSIQCYRGPDSDCGPNGDVYAYGRSLQQAYLEVARGVNCFAQPCTVFNDGAFTDQARWALFYAMKTTGRTGSYFDFVANFLGYYWYSVGNTQWNNRWWVFNHHGLVGPKYGYSPCHAY